MSGLQQSNSSSHTILVPCCGKTVDMIYLCQLGHNVVATELVEKPILEFINENKFKFTKSTFNSTTTLYDIVVPKSTSDDSSSPTPGSLRIYHGDLFQLTTKVLGYQVDGVLDRGALVAMDDDMVEAYAICIVGLLKTGGKYLLLSTHYDGTNKKDNGPPHSFDKTRLNNLYVKKLNCTLKELDDRKIQVQKDSELYKRGLRVVFRNPCLITKQ